MARLRITYRDGRSAEELSLGAFAQIAAKRRYGLEALKSEDPEVALFGCFVELEGAQTAKDPDAFDLWLQNVEAFEVAEEDPPKAETLSSDTSPGSPPISD